MQKTIFFTVAIIAFMLSLAQSEEKIDFNRHIRPIFSDTCFVCHGPDEGTRKMDLRLDLKEHAFAQRGDMFPIVPGKPAESEIYRRLKTNDPALKMPPPAADLALTGKQIEMVRKWIEQGAAYKRHWAYIPPAKTEFPKINQQDWIRQPLDYFSLRRLEQEGLQPSPEADKRTLIRRATLDLTGLVPTPEEVAAFLEDDSENSYEKLLDRLLTSPRYGEHLAAEWLDAARYADTNGYHIDNGRDMWVWREWAIKAFNANKRYDEFVIEQMAGDLLPDPTQEQLIASGFNRNHGISFEGGIIDEEYRVEYVADRVKTVSTVFLGLTMECARCHSHKYDPISMEDYYRFFAYFNNIAEKGKDGNSGNAQPMIKTPSDEQETRLAELGEKIKLVEAKLFAPMPEVDQLQSSWEQELAKSVVVHWKPLKFASMKSSGDSKLVNRKDRSILVKGKNPNKDSYTLELSSKQTINALRLDVLLDKSLPKKGPGRAPNGNIVVTEFEVESVSKQTPDKPQKIEFAKAYADYSQPDFPVANAIDGKSDTGWATNSHNRREERVAIFVFKHPVVLDENTSLRVRIKQESKYTQHTLGHFKLSATNSDTPLGGTIPELRAWHMLGPFAIANNQEGYDKSFIDESQQLDLKKNHGKGQLAWTKKSDFEDGKIHNLNGLNTMAATYVYRRIDAHEAGALKLSLGSDDAFKLWLNGKLIIENNVARAAEPDQDKITVQLQKGRNDLLMKVVNFGGGHAFYFKSDYQQEIPINIQNIAALPTDKRNDKQKTQLQKFYRKKIWEGGKQVSTEIARLEKEKLAVEKKIVTTMVMRERTEPRETFLLERGQYNSPSKKVTAAVPASIMPQKEGRPNNRLGLAQWMTDPQNPLLARVTVNRLWQRIFGVGIVKTVENFGSQSAWPSHPDLLDWLAVDFIESGWDLKALQKKIMLSATYRQQSDGKPALIRNDPENRLLARGPRFRMGAEMIRDNALFYGGLLVEKIGGPSVNPYQAPGLWQEVSFPATKGRTAQVFKLGAGDELHRRTMYTFWKRTAPPPSLKTFDAPEREFCIVRRSRTNTPLQSLVLLNNPMYVEASIALAEKMLLNGGDTAEARLKYAFEKTTLTTAHKKRTGDPDKAIKPAPSEIQQATAESRSLAWSRLVHEKPGLEKAGIRGLRNHREHDFKSR